MSVPYPIGSSGTTDPITNAYVVTAIVTSTTTIVLRKSAAADQLALS